MLMRFNSPFTNIHLDPFEDFITIHNQLNHMLSEFEVAPRLWSGDRYPKLDMIDMNDDLMVIAELPGINKEEIKVTMNNGTLTISGERKKDDSPVDGAWLRTERSFGQFSRSFSIPYPVQTDKISAEFKNGVLKLVLPKREDAKPKKIEVKVN